jgi:hypothetical protein
VCISLHLRGEAEALCVCEGVGQNALERGHLRPHLAQHRSQQVGGGRHGLQLVRVHGESGEEEVTQLVQGL